MTTTPGDHANPDDRDEHDPSAAHDIDDDKLPEDLQPSEDNPLAAGPEESSDSDSPGGAVEPPD